MQHHRDLELFLHLIETLNYGRTSLECHVSTATLTRTVQRLELQCGERLLDRGPRGVAPTAAGHRFAGYARAALALWREHRADTDAPTDLAGELRLFATVTACQALLPTLLEPLRRAHPRVRLDLRTGDAGTALARLDEGEVDAAVAGLPERLPHSLVGRTVTTTDLVLITALGNEAGHHDAPLIVPRRGLVRDAAERWLRAHGHRPTITAEPDSHEALLTLVALGYGTGIVPRLVLDTSATNARLSIVEEHLAPYPIGLCVRRTELRRDLIARLWATTRPGSGDGWE